MENFYSIDRRLIKPYKNHKYMKIAQLIKYTIYKQISPVHSVSSQSIALLNLNSRTDLTILAELNTLTILIKITTLTILTKTTTLTTFTKNNYTN